jgi:hypothetical protein
MLKFTFVDSMRITRAKAGSARDGSNELIGRRFSFEE